MCGICGFHYSSEFPKSKEAMASILDAMNAALYHRGPDDGGAYLDRSVGLAMRRLAIIDIEGGHQPMTSDDGSLAIVFNGEIYNFLELRKDLEAKGVRFHSHSDTEVVLKLYEDQGEACLNKLNGMFAFAIWDKREHTLLLARDRFGKKPLYYTAIGEGLLFASEMKSLLRHPDCPRALNPDGLALFLSYDYVPAPESILAGIFKLPAGHLLRLKQGKIEVERYWNLRFSTHGDDGPTKDILSLARSLRDKLKRAVEYRLISDVPLGVFLSGGIDSSLITALMCELRPPQSVKTFSIHFDEKSFDESAYSTQVARHFGTDHHSRLFRSGELLDRVPKIAAHLDEPFADASIFPTFLLSQFTREHVTVALGGDGSDELLAGYPTFFAARLARLYARLPVFAKRIIEKNAFKLKSSTKNMSFDFKLKQFLSGMGETDTRQQQAWLSGFLPRELNSVLSGDLQKSRNIPDPYSLLDREMAHCGSAIPLERAIYFYAKFYLAEDILTKTDRASMANSLEVRAPFLDRDFVDFISTLPPALKLRRSTGKYLLRTAARGLLPDAIIDRPKQGFGIPIAHWFRHELREFLSDELGRQTFRESGLFNTTEIDRLIAEHSSGARDHRKKLFPLFMFALWKRAYLDNRA